jgi:hypothetical protein
VEGFDWPILHNPINVLESSAVPVVVAIYEHSIVRSIRPDPKTFEAEFLSKSFTDDPAAKPTPVRHGPTHPSDLDRLAAAAKEADTAAGWRAVGGALALWGGDKKVSEEIAAYSAAVKRDPKDGPASFRLGVCLRRRSESVAREKDAFRAAVAAWGAALELDPNQYLWRRRIQPYGPRLDKPYPFYDWVPDAEAAIRKRGETPVVLPVRPDGAEVAQPVKAFATTKDTPTNPDPNGKVNRDKGSVTCEVVVVPAAVKAGESARIHLTFRLAPKTADHWNNEADPLRVWVDPPDGVAVSDRLIAAESPKAATSVEARAVGFEVQVPKAATGTIRVPVFALYHLCDDAGGQCRFVRLDATVDVTVK